MARTWKIGSAIALVAVLLEGASPAGAAATVRISKLQDVSLLALNPFVGASQSQSICVFSNTATRGYSVTARGSGPGSAFTLTTGGLTLPYSVEWSQTSGQTLGAALTPNIPLTGMVSVATVQACGSGPSSSASLIVRLTTADLQTASAGLTYTGALTLVIAPE